MKGVVKAKQIASCLTRHADLWCKLSNLNIRNVLIWMANARPYI